MDAPTEQVVTHVSPETIVRRDELARVTGLPVTAVFENLLQMADRESEADGLPRWMGTPVRRRPRPKANQPRNPAQKPMLHMCTPSGVETFTRLHQLTGGAKWWVAERLFEIGFQRSFDTSSGWTDEHRLERVLKTA